MTLTLRAVSLNDHPLTQPITAHFDAEGGSVGRSDHNTLALPDPERHISRQHAEISASSTGTGYRIKNVGSANPIIVRGQPLARGESAPLAHRDQVRIGGYLLEVIQEDAQDDEASTVVRHRAAVDAATPGITRRSTGSSPSAAGSPNANANANASASAAAGMGELGGALSPSNPFADLLGDLTPPPRPALPPSATLPDDFDPFAAPPPAAAPAAATTPHAEGAFDDLIPRAEPASIDQLFGLQSDGRDPLADFMAGTTPPRSNTHPSGSPQDHPASTDPMAMFGLPAGADSPAFLPEPTDRVHELQAAFTPPFIKPRPAAAPRLREAASAPAAEPAAASHQRDADPADPQALWSAFCEGAGVSIEPAGQATPEAMRMAGNVLRAAVAGTLQLMAVRATAKHELRAQVTMIQARNNNPLKFSPDARSALEQLLQPPMRGFLSGPAAMTDAMHDLVGHAIGTMAGTRAALEGVLDRFTPQQLDTKLTGRSMLDTVLPMNRKAKLWELYLQHFDAIRHEAHDDFHSLFGRAFLAAYEQQLDRLHAEEVAKNSTA